MNKAEEKALITDSAVKTALGGGTGLTDKNTSDADAPTISTWSVVMEVNKYYRMDDVLRQCRGEDGSGLGQRTIEFKVGDMNLIASGIDAEILLASLGHEVHLQADWTKFSADRKYVEINLSKLVFDVRLTYADGTE